MNGSHVSINFQCRGAHFNTRILDDYEGMEKEMRAACQDLLKIAPKIKAIVLECTNMPPFTHVVAQETGLRVWDIITLGKWLYAGATPVDHRR